MKIKLSDILEIKSENCFEELALEIFKYQAQECKVYRDYLTYLGKKRGVQHIKDIPFLPIEFFKNHVIKTGDWIHETEFRSSGTGGLRSSHYVKGLGRYLQLSEELFNSFLGEDRSLPIIAMLPSYMEQGDSSLVTMVENLISKNPNPISGFYQDVELVSSILKDLADGCILFGVTYALLDLADTLSFNPERRITIIETGGMKGRKKELTRNEVHQVLCKKFGVTAVRSEYGMTELMSQFYSYVDGLFMPSPSAKVLVRELNDPFSVRTHGVGGLNIIDLGNFETCSFVETKDQGQVYKDGSFKVIGRLDNSDIRGCNLLYTG